MRFATCVSLVVALPGLVLGSIVKALETPDPCSEDVRLLINGVAPSGPPCTSFDFSVLFWLAPAAALLVIGFGVASARYSEPQGSARVR